MQKYRDKEWMNILQIALGLFFCKVAYNAFLIPNNIAAGGFTGIGQHLFVFVERAAVCSVV